MITQSRDFETPHDWSIFNYLSMRLAAKFRPM